MAVVIKEHLGGSSLEHFSRIVSPLHWKDVFIAMLTICFDGAGKDANGYNVVTVAGFP